MGRNIKLYLTEILNYIWQKYEECVKICCTFPPLLQLNENILDTKLNKLRRIFGRNARNVIFCYKPRWKWNKWHFLTNATFPLLQSHRLAIASARSISHFHFHYIFIWDNLHTIEIYTKIYKMRKYCPENSSREQMCMLIKNFKVL